MTDWRDDPEASRFILLTRDLPDGRMLDVTLLITGTAQLTISANRAAMCWDDGF